MSQEPYKDQFEEENYNADDPEQVNKARKKAKRAEIQRQEVIRGIMSVKEGRAWIYHILEFSSMFGNPIASGDPYATYCNIGMANLGKMIWAEVEEATPEYCTTMLKEAKKNAKEQEL